MAEELMRVQAIPKVEFNPASLTGTFQVLNGSGLSDDIKVYKLYNGSTTVSIELSLDGITAHDFMPPLGTCIIDYQTNHSAITTYGNGTLYLAKGQLIWGRTAANPTYLQIIGFR